MHSSLPWFQPQQEKVVRTEASHSFLASAPANSGGAACHCAGTRTGLHERRDRPHVGGQVWYHHRAPEAESNQEKILKALWKKHTTVGHLQVCPRPETEPGKEQGRSFVMQSADSSISTSAVKHNGVITQTCHHRAISQLTQMGLSFTFIVGSLPIAAGRESPCGSGVILEAVIVPRSNKHGAGPPRRWGGEGERKCPDSQLLSGKESSSSYMWKEEHKEATRQC